MADAKDYGEPWCVDPETGEWCRQADGRLALGTYSNDSTRGLDKELMSRTVACVNALAGVPDATLAAPDEMARLALAVLRGDRTAALALADRVSEEWRAEAVPSQPVALFTVKCLWCGGTGIESVRPNGEARECPQCHGLGDLVRTPA